MISDQNSRLERSLDVVIVGAGFAGLYMLYQTRRMGLRAQVIEAGADVGGTWYWNRYPGARCDVESLEYSYSFSSDLQQQWRWPDRFSGQADILRYLHHVADRFDLFRSVTLNSRIHEAHFDDTAREWRVVASDGRDWRARFCVMATGNLSLPRVPAFPGLDSFEGRWFHTGLWPKDPIDFSGRRVGVVGTGSSGIQLIPVVAKQAKHLTVFQRTANFSVPAVNRPLTDDIDQAHKARYDVWRDEARRTPFGIAGHPPPHLDALDDSPEVRDRKYETKWGIGGNISFLYTYRDLLTNDAANETAADFVRRKIRSIVKDPSIAELLAPKDHPIGAKRLCLDDGYYETFNRDNVTLVDVRKHPIERVSRVGVRISGADYELDDLIFATGFDAMTGALLDIDIRGARGRSLREKWRDGPVAYLGLMTADFPNLFMITGPGSPSVKTNMVMSIEQHVDWIAGCLAGMDERGQTLISVDPLSEAKWVAHVDEIAQATLYVKADSWYLGSNIPGKPRVFMPYIAGLDRYKAICDAVVERGYEGFIMRR